MQTNPNQPHAFSNAEYNEAADFLRAATTLQPHIGLVLGSGLNSLADAIDDATVIEYADIPHFPTSTVHGHAGRMVIGTLEGQAVCTMQGRFHFYEGYSMAQVTLPVRVMKRLGVKTLILTNAAGGLNPNFRVGDLMLINDHINLPGMVGNNPLMGPNMEEFGTRFPPMNRAYTPRLRTLAQKRAQALDVQLHQGVYVALSGPVFETAAEVRMLRAWGGDAVGMSTAPEATVAQHAGMEVLAFSTITNVAIDVLDAEEEPHHEEVAIAGRRAVPALTRLLRGVLAQIEK